MELKQKIERLKQDRTNLINRLETLEKEIFKYENLTHIITPLLVKELSEIEALKKCATKGFGINVYNGTYQYMLGGDGRSQPWDEQRKGVICDVETMYYLTDVQKNLVSEYLKSLGKIDKLNFK